MEDFSHEKETGERDVGKGRKVLARDQAGGKGFLPPDMP
jgi:hypothetical protein